MDIAYYLSELLEQLGEVNVPGLGSFTRVRVDGYYNGDEGRFYPPTSKLEFTQQYVDDDVLTQYIGVKKRISLASSKYFTEKYITGLKQEVISREIPFAELGSLYFSNGRIQFRAAQALPDPEFYGYPTISLNKKSAEPAYHYEEPVVTPEPGEVEEELHEHIYEPFTEDDHLHEPVTINEPEVKEETVEEEQVNYEHTTPYEPERAETIIEEHNDYFTPQQDVTTPQIEEEDDFIFHSADYKEPEVEEEKYEEEIEDEPARSYKWLWITLIILVVASGGVFGWFYYQQQQGKPVKKAKTAAAPRDTTDSTSITPTAKDTSVGVDSSKVILVQNAPSSTIDSTKRRYEVIGGEAPTLAEANKMIENFKSIALTAHIVNDAPGRRKKISLGTYNTKAEAITAVNDLRKTRKVKDPWTLTINPKK